VIEVFIFTNPAELDAVQIVILSSGNCQEKTVAAFAMEHKGESLAEKVLPHHSDSVEDTTNKQKGFVLGIDLGTTSVKVCVLDSEDGSVVAEVSKETEVMIRITLIYFSAL